MPTLAQAIASMNPLWDQMVVARGRDVTFIAANAAARITVRAVEGTQWVASETQGGEVVEADFQLICRDDELVAGGINRAPYHPDYFLVDGIQRYVEGATPVIVGGTLFGFKVALAG